MEGGLVSPCWCMCIVSHGYGGLGGSRDGGGGWYACWTMLGRVFCISGDDGALPVCEVIQ